MGNVLLGEEESGYGVLRGAEMEEKGRGER